MQKLDIENVFIDLDGTTLKSDKTISKNTLNIIRELQNKNINVFVATGRPPYMIKYEIEELNVSEYIITVNGGLIFNNKNKEVLQSRAIDSVSANKIINHLVSNNIPYLIYSDKDMFYNSDEKNIWVNYLMKRISSLDEKYKWKFKKIDSSFNIDKHMVVKLLIPTHEIGDDVIKALNNWFKTEMKNFILLASQEDILDIIPSSSSKGEGIKFLSDLLSLDLNKTLAFGDADNDIPMFKAVKYSVAMNNAVIGLKKVATYVTDSNDEDGIYNFLKNKVL